MQEWHFPCHIWWLSCSLWCSFPDATQWQAEPWGPHWMKNSRCTVYVRNADSSWDASCHKDFKAVYLEEQELKNNLFWWLYFLSVKYKRAQLMTLEPGSLLFILTSCPGSSRRQLSCHYQSHYQEVGAPVTSAHLPEVMTGHSYLWRRNQKWKQIVLKLVSTLNTRRRKPNLLLLWNSQLHDYWGKICSSSENKKQPKTCQSKGQAEVENKISSEVVEYIW